MRRPPLAVVCACSIALFAVLGGPAAADETTPPPHDDRRAPPPTTTTEPPPPAGPKLIQPGVTIGGLLVGGLTAPEARALVEERFVKPVTLVVSPTRKLRVEPTELGAAAQVLKAVKTAVRVRTRDSRPAQRRGQPPEARRYLATSRRRPTTSRSTRASCCATSARRQEVEAGAPAEAGDRVPAALARDPQARALAARAAVRGAPPEGDRGRPRQGDRDQARLAHAPLLQRHEAEADVPRRDRPVVLPDADRRVRDRHEAAQPVVVSAAGLRLGGRQGARPARAGEPARDALDGHLGTVRRHPRHA